MSSNCQHSCLGRLNHWKTTGIIGIFSIALFAGAGCGKSSKTVPVAAPAPSASDSTAVKMAATPPANWTQPPAKANPAKDSGPTQLQMLNRAVLGWKMEHHRQPRSIEDFASTVGFQIPPPPEGKKYALDSKGFIILVNSD